MRIGWCPQHRGVMRISFFEPPTTHFGSPCPRCGNKLTYQERGKYEKPIFIEEDARSFASSLVRGFREWPDEIVTKAPKPLCSCCEYFKIRPDYSDLCSWCVDCRTDYCDVPLKYFIPGKSPNS